MNKPYFTLSEFLIEKSPEPPLSVSEKIMAHHIWPMNAIRAELGVPIMVSKNSGYRSVDWEKGKGRDGLSEHTFQKNPHRQSEGLGAADYITRPGNMVDLGIQLVARTDYTRICFYPDVNTPFYHCDYRFPDRGKRLFLFRSGDNDWNEVDAGMFIRSVEEAHK